MSTLSFMILAPLIVVSALSVILWKNPISSALSLVVTLVSLAIVYFMLEAPFIGILQVLIYAGAIMVLFIFVIMLINLKDEELESVRWSPQTILKLLSLGLVFTGIAFAVRHAMRARPLREAPMLSDNFGSIEHIGRLLFTRYLLPFELISFVILAAVIGAVLLARRGAQS